MPVVYMIFHKNKNLMKFWRTEANKNKSLQEKLKQDLKSNNS